MSVRKAYKNKRSPAWTNSRRYEGFMLNQMALAGLCVPETAEVKQMFVLYLLAENSREFEILTRRKRFRLAVMYDNESAWMVPGTVSADD